jgi:hypothetical protein
MSKAATGEKQKDGSVADAFDMQGKEPPGFGRCITVKFYRRNFARPALQRFYVAYSKDAPR